MTVAEAVKASTDFLAGKDVPSPRVDAEHLVAQALGITRLDIYLQYDRPLTDEETAACRELVRRRGTREPLAYILGEWGFRRLTLKVDSRALIPRPETEVVVERCLALLDGAEAPVVLDVGTGTGAIALAIADEQPDAMVTAVDVSEDALALARENAERLGLDVELREGDETAAVEGWELVVSNPPYVDSLRGLQPELRHEPKVALLGDGLHERIACIAETRAIVFEVGDGQANDVAGVLEHLGYRDIRVTRDLAGVERVVDGFRG
jgi:release factor glutamine methyltransferase